jgi:hypothetical protein
MLPKTVEISNPATVGAVRHILQEIERGETLAAADHLLVRDQKDDLALVVRKLLSELPEFLKSRPNVESNVFTALIRIGLNLIGYDAQLARIPSGTVKGALSALKEKTVNLEESWSESAKVAVQSYLEVMSSVNSGDSLPAYMSERIRKELTSDHALPNFIDAFAEVARQTIYWKMIENGYCKFGNDFARGLEILRHLGFSQVSTNPVLAVKAFEEDPSLVKRLEEEIEKHPSWKQDPPAHGHKMVMAGTLLALWPNLEVFRPLALLANNRDYMISFQLNPNVADDFTASLEDAERAYTMVREHLTAYDRHLGLSNPGKVAPNLVFKVAGSSSAARQITQELNARGMGTNNTVTYTVAQEVQLIIDALEGKAEAIKSGKSVTRTYETNMGGRFVSHLREEEAKRIILKIATRKGEHEADHVLTRLAKKLNLSEQEIERAEQMPSIAEKIDIVCSFRHLKSLTHEAFIDVASEAALSQDQVQQLEMDLRKAGTIVARRVYRLFYDRRNRNKWVDWLTRGHQIGRTDAILILDSMDILPASKRIPEDTYDTLASTNMCNTEFPNHAKAVQLFSEKENFNLVTYMNAALRPPDAQLVERLMKIGDFIRGYESTKETSEVLVRVGVLSHLEDLGLGGVSEEEWHQFGPVRKTMAEFQEAYDKFLERCVTLASARRKSN